MALRNFTAKPTLTNITTALNGTDAPGTSTTVGLASTANLPAAPFTAGLDLHQGAEEVVLVTAVVGGTATITRGYDGTAVSAHASGTATFEHVTSSIDFTEANVHVNATTDVHGASGSLVDTDSAQTISGIKTFSVAPSLDSDVHFSSAVRRTIYPLVTDVGLQVRSNGAGLLELNTDNAGDVKIAGGGGKTTLGAGGLQLPRGASINTDGGTANTLLGSEQTAGTSFTDSTASDLIIKEPNGQAVRIGVHGASGVQSSSVMISATPGVQMTVWGNGVGAGVGLGRTAGAYDGQVVVSAAAAAVFSDSAAGDLIVKGVAGTLRLGVGSASMLRLTNSDALINDNGVQRSLPRGVVYAYRATATATSTSTASPGTALWAANTAGVWSPTSLTGNQVTLVNGRRYRVTLTLHSQSSALAVANHIVTLNSAAVAAGGTPAGSVVMNANYKPAATAAYQPISYNNEITVAASGADVVGGTYYVAISAYSGSASTITVFGSAAPASTAQVTIEDIGI